MNARDEIQITLGIVGNILAKGSCTHTQQLFSEEDLQPNQTGLLIFHSPMDQSVNLSAPPYPFSAFYVNNCAFGYLPVHTRAHTVMQFQSLFFRSWESCFSRTSSRVTKFEIQSLILHVFEFHNGFKTT